MRPEDKSPDLPQSYDELRLLYLEVYNENMQLRKLLEKHHILAVLQTLYKSVRRERHNVGENRS